MDKISLLLTPSTDTSVCDMQAILMDHFFRSTEDSFIGEFSEGQTTRDICKWKGGSSNHQQVKCEDDHVTEVHIFSLNVGNFHVSYLPSSIMIIVISYSHQKYALETRLLPQHVIQLELQKNKIFGSVDLKTLPCELQILDLSRNRISGKINILYLPDSLRILNLHQNKINQKYVYIDTLPDKMFSISLGGNEIESVRSLREKVDLVRHNVFSGIHVDFEMHESVPSPDSYCVNIS